MARCTRQDGARGDIVDQLAEQDAIAEASPEFMLVLKGNWLPRLHLEEEGRLLASAFDALVLRGAP